MTGQALALLFVIATLLLPMVVTTFLWGFAAGSSPRGKRDADAIEELLRKEKRK